MTFELLFFPHLAEKDMAIAAKDNNVFPSGKDSLRALVKQYSDVTYTIKYALLLEMDFFYIFIFIMFILEE